jgi:alkylation response protein AidB-like acyl-CoA dehydrogenase
MLQGSKLDFPAGSETPPVASLVKDVHSIAKGLAATAVERERAGKLPFEEIALLRRSNLLHLLVPEEAGGPGGTWRDAMTITRILAHADGSIGQLVGYHYLNAVIVELVGTSAQIAGLHHALLHERWFIGDSVNPLDPSLSVATSGSGVVLSGKKSFSTGAAVADRVLIAFNVDGVSRFALIPSTRRGFVANDDWDNMGQRLSASGSVTFNEVAVDATELLGRDEPSVSPRSTLVPPLIQSIFVNVNLGIAEGALAAAIAYTRDTSRPWFKSGAVTASEDGHILAEYGRLSSRLAASRALATEVAIKLDAALGCGEALTADERGQVAVESFQSKVESTTAALDVTAKMFELTGARSTGRRHGFDRYWRDVRTLSLHDPVIYKAREVGDFVVNGRIPEVSTYS